MAALMVVYFHSVLQIGKALPSSNLHVPLFGSSGVDVFFVLSGFIMWRSTRKGHHGAMGFLKRRFARIAPLYWLLTLLAAAIAVVAPTVLRSTRFDSVHLLASLAFVPWPNPAAVGQAEVLMTPVIVPGWTLNFEMMFYVLFALGLVGSSRPRVLRLTLVFAVFMIFIVAMKPLSRSVGFYDPLLIGEFLLGIAIGIAADANRLAPFKPAVALLVLASIVLVTMDSLNPHVHRLFVWGLPAATCLYALVSIDLAGRWPKLPLLTRLGDASYSLYLSHIFVLTALRILFASNLGFMQPETEALAFLIAAMALSTLLGFAMFRFVERPLGALVHILFGLPREPRTVWAKAEVRPSVP